MSINFSRPLAVYNYFIVASLLVPSASKQLNISIISFFSLWEASLFFKRLFSKNIVERRESMVLSYLSIFLVRLSSDISELWNCCTSSTFGYYFYFETATPAITPPFFYPFWFWALPAYPFVATFFCSFPSYFFSGVLSKTTLRLGKVATCFTTLWSMLSFSVGPSLGGVRLLLMGEGGFALGFIPLMIGLWLMSCV